MSGISHCHTTCWQMSHHFLSSCNDWAQIHIYLMFPPHSSNVFVAPLFWGCHMLACTGSPNLGTSMWHLLFSHVYVMCCWRPRSVLCICTTCATKLSHIYLNRIHHTFTQIGYHRNIGVHITFFRGEAKYFLSYWKSHYNNKKI